MPLRECPCGSGEFPEAAYDARGIFLTYVCVKCRRTRLSTFRRDVLDDPNYECDEPIGDGDEGPCTSGDLLGDESYDDTFLGD